jgi:hypothetical protein
MNDQEWQALDAQLKRAFDELRASCAKARKAHVVSTRLQSQAEQELVDEGDEAMVEETMVDVDLPSPSSVNQFKG